MGQGRPGSSARVGEHGGSVARVSLNIKPIESDTRHQPAAAAGRPRHRTGARHLRDADRHDPGHRRRPGRRSGGAGLDPQLDERRPGRAAARVRASSATPSAAGGCTSPGWSPPASAPCCARCRWSRCCSSPAGSSRAAAVPPCWRAGWPCWRTATRWARSGCARPRSGVRRSVSASWAARCCPRSSTSAPAGGRAYWVTAVLALALVPPSLRWMAESSAAVRRRVDVAGLGLLVAAMTLAVSRAHPGPQRRSTCRPWCWPCSPSSRSRRSSSSSAGSAAPLLDPELLRHPRFRAATGGSLVLGAGMIGMASFTPTMVQVGLRPRAVGGHPPGGRVGRHRRGHLDAGPPDPAPARGAASGRAVPGRGGRWPAADLRPRLPDRHVAAGGARSSWPARPPACSTPCSAARRSPRCRRTAPRWARAPTTPPATSAPPVGITLFVTVATHTGGRPVRRLERRGTGRRRAHPARGRCDRVDRAPHRPRALDPVVRFAGVLDLVASCADVPRRTAPHLVVT